MSDPAWSLLTVCLSEALLAPAVGLLLLQEDFRSKYICSKKAWVTLHCISSEKYCDVHRCLDPRCSCVCLENGFEMQSERAWLCIPDQGNHFQKYRSWHRSDSSRQRTSIWYMAMIILALTLLFINLFKLTLNKKKDFPVASKLLGMSWKCWQD